MKKSAKYLFLVLIVSFNLKAQNACLDSYSSKIDYQKSLAMIMMNLSPEMQQEIAIQLKISAESDLSQVGTTKLEAMFFEHIAKAYAENKFDQVFDQMVGTLLAQPQLKARVAAMPEEKKQELLAMFKAGLLGEMQLRKFFGKEFAADIWSKIANRIEKKMDDFTQWVHVLTWSVYDDATGIKFADQMIEKKRQGIDVKIIVDALTSQKEGHKSQLIRMQQNGVEVIYSNSLPSNRKSFLISISSDSRGGVGNKRVCGGC